MKGWRRAAFWMAYSLIYDALWDNALADAVADAVDDALGDGREVLEIGAGTGITTRRLIERGRSVRATEPNAAMARRLRRRVSVPVCEAGYDAVHPARNVSAVVAVNVVHLVDDPHAAISRLRELAGPGGRVVLVAPVDGVTLLDVAFAQRRCGVARWRIARFVALHALLAPITRVSGMALGKASSRMWKAFEIAETTVEGVSRVATLTGVPWLGSARGESSPFSADSALCSLRTSPYAIPATPILIHSSTESKGNAHVAVLGS